MKIQKILIVPLAIIFLYLVVWSAFVTFRFKPFCDSLGIVYSSLQQNVTLRDGDYPSGYTYDVHKPYFPSFTGNISVSENVDSDQVGNASIYFIFWPKGLNSYRYALFINDITEDSVNMNVVELDKNLKPTRYCTDDAKDLYNKYLDRIERLYALSHDMWGIPKQ